MLEWYKNRKERRRAEKTRGRIASALQNQLSSYVNNLGLVDGRDSTVMLNSGDEIETFYRKGTAVIAKIVDGLQAEELTEEEARKRLDFYMSGLEKLKIDVFKLKEIATYDHDKNLFIYNRFIYSVPVIKTE